MDHSQEKTFIRRCLKALVLESPLVGDGSLFDGRMDWDFLIRTGESHRVLAFVGALLEKEGYLNCLNPSVSLRVKSAMGFASWENRIRMLEFEKVLTFFQEEDIPVIPLKGVALTPLVYAKVPFRRMADIDLLIHQEHLRKSKIFLAEHSLHLKQMQNRWQAELLARAWGRYSFTDGSLDLDLQWNPRFLIGGRWVALDMERVWQRAQPFPGMGKSVFVFSPADQAIHLSLQILNDIDNNIPRLAQLLDLALVMERNHVVRGAVLEGAAPFLDTEGCGRLARLLEAVDESFLNKMDDYSFPEKSSSILEPFFCPILSENLPKIPIAKMIVSPWERVLYEVGYLFPSEDYLRASHYQGIFGTIFCYFGHWTGLISKMLARCQMISKKRL